MHVQPHFYRVRQVEPCRHLGEVARHSSWAIWLLALFLYICMHFFIGVAQKDHVGTKIELTVKIMCLYMSQMVFECTLLRYWDKRYLSTRHAKLFLILLWVLPVRWRSPSDGLISPGLLENLNSWVASMSIWLYSIACVRIKSFLSFLFSRNCSFEFLFVSKASKTFHLPWCCPLYSF